jgi:hypothetical protein
VMCFKAARKTASGFASTCFPVPHIEAVKKSNRGDSL